MAFDLKDLAALGTLLSQAVGAIRKLRESKLSDENSAALSDLTDIVSDASGRLFSLQTALVTLQQENVELASQIASMKRWE